MQSIKVYRVNAFSDQLFRGNPAGVCITDNVLPDTLMKNIAMEMAASETAFICLRDMTLRWFTPVREVSLCGHATLAAAHVLYHHEFFEKALPIHFKTVSGILKVISSNGLITMIFPLIEVEAQEIEKALIEALGVLGGDVLFTGRAGKKHLIQVKDEDTLNALSPDFEKMACLPGRGVIVTSSSKKMKYDFVSRYFAPWVGVNEDPVTGSAHCALMPYWYKVRGKSEMLAYQNSSRGGEVLMKLVENGVILSGKAVLALEGELCIEQ